MTRIKIQSKKTIYPNDVDNQIECVVLLFFVLKKFIRRNYEKIQMYTLKLILRILLFLSDEFYLINVI